MPKRSKSSKKPAAELTVSNVYGVIGNISSSSVVNPEVSTSLREYRLKNFLSYEELSLRVGNVSAMTVRKACLRIGNLDEKSIYAITRFLERVKNAA